MHVKSMLSKYLSVIMIIASTYQCSPEVQGKPQTIQESSTDGKIISLLTYRIGPSLVIDANGRHSIIENGGGERDTIEYCERSVTASSCGTAVAMLVSSYKNALIIDFEAANRQAVAAHIQQIMQLDSDILLLEAQLSVFVDQKARAEDKIVEVTSRIYKLTEEMAILKIEMESSPPAMRESLNVKLKGYFDLLDIEEKSQKNAQLDLKSASETITILSAKIETIKNEKLAALQSFKLVDPAIKAAKVVDDIKNLDLRVHEGFGMDSVFFNPFRKNATYIHPWDCSVLYRDDGSSHVYGINTDMLRGRIFPAISQFNIAGVSVVKSSMTLERCNKKGGAGCLQDGWNMQWPYLSKLENLSIGAFTCIDKKPAR